MLEALNLWHTHDPPSLQGHFEARRAKTYPYIPKKGQNEPQIKCPKHHLFPNPPPTHRHTNNSTKIHTKKVLLTIYN